MWQGQSLMSIAMHTECKNEKTSILRYMYWTEHSPRGEGRKYFRSVDITTKSRHVHGKSPLLLLV